MSQDVLPTRPAWVSDEIFPFESNFFTTPSGHEMHFIDEGAGEPIVFLHGNPAWSFEFRHLVKDLRSRFRCIAPDHIGFGLSSRSNQPAHHRPQAHAKAVAALLDHLDVQGLTLYLTDWGEPIVFLHGNPAWSFEFRHLVKDLRSRFRCIAPDHIGFGLSSRSNQPAHHRPQAHAKAVAALLDHLDVQGLTLYLTDWGGPIGLNFARKHPQRVKRVVITNTWCWPVARDPHYVMFSFFMSSWVGQYLIKRHNFFVNRVLPMAVAQKEALTPDVMAHYRNALPTPEARAACAAFPGHIVGATDWLRSIWDDRAAFIAKPALIFWGFKDIAFRKKELDRWKSELADFEAHEFKDCGHFLAEEAPDRILPALRAFMQRTQ